MLSYGGVLGQGVYSKLCGQGRPNNGMHPTPLHGASHARCNRARVMPGVRWLPSGERSMLKAILRFAKNVLTSRLGLILCLVHFLFFAYAILEKQPAPRGEDMSWAEFQQLGSSSSLFAGRNLHWHYESALLQVLLVLDLPAMFAVSIFSEVFLPQSFAQLSVWTVSWIGAGLMVFFSSLQWLLVGYCIERWLVVSKELNRPPKVES